MKRKEFIKSGLTLPLLFMDINCFSEIASDEKSPRMPVLFVGHGNPMNAIEENLYHKKWQELGKSLPPPKAILCISAHWQTRGSKVTYMDTPPTIHDFGGFPKALFDVEYPAPGGKSFADETIAALKPATIEKSSDWGLDHGTWSVIKPMYPDAKIPVYQLSLDYTLSPRQHADLATRLKALREKGILIVGSGNIVHNLGLINWDGKAFDWAIEFDSMVKTKIDSGDLNALINYESLGQAAKLSIPTNEHYLPLLYTLALQDKADTLSYFNETVEMGSISMRSILMGG